MMEHAENGKVALVTGGAQGIGLACCVRLHADSFEVGIADQNTEAAANAADGLGGSEGGARAVQIDVADREKRLRRPPRDLKGPRP